MRDLGIIGDGAIAVEGNLVTAVGVTSAIRGEFRARDEIDARGCVIVPGFVDPHTHAVFAGSRVDEFDRRLGGASYLEIMAAGGGILSTTRATRAATPVALKAIAGDYLQRMLRLGTTSVEIKTGYGLDLATEMKMLEVIEELDRELPLTLVPTFMPAHAIPPEFRGRSGEYVDLIVDEMLPAAVSWYERSHFAEARRPFFVDVFCESEAFSLEESQRVLERALSLGLLLKAHVDQFTNLGGARLAMQLGAISIDHLDAISHDELILLGTSPTIAVVTPAVSFSSGGCDFADARGLIDVGAAVALTTDFNPGSAPCLSLPLVMAIACRYCHLTPAEALNAVTINAAHAIALGDRVGSIEKGKQADILVSDVDDYRLLAYEFGDNPLRTVIRSGKVVMGND